MILYENDTMTVTAFHIDGRKKYFVNYKTGGYSDICRTLEQAKETADYMDSFVKSLNGGIENES